MRKGTHPTIEAREKMSIAKQGIYNGEGNPRWNGGEVRQRGYIYIYKPEHPCCNPNGYIRKHRVIMEEFLGRCLLPEEVVHHINNIRDDNRIENLELFKNHSKHLKHHKELQQAINILKEIK